MRWRRRVGAGASVLATMVALSLVGPVPAAGADSEDGLAPLRDHPGAVEDSYIVVLRPGIARSTADSVVNRVGALGGEVTYRYTTVLDGFAAVLPAEAVAELRRDRRVAYLEQDVLSYPDAATATRQAPPLEPEAATSLQQAQTVPDGAWGLDRIDQRTLPLDDTYSYATTGQGVTAYLIDTGIRETHEDFDGRAEGVLDLVDDGLGTEDCWNHGTPVAGILGGTEYGVAKDVELKAIRIFGCNTGAPESRIIAAMDWVTANATLPAVVNLNTNGPESAARDQAAGRLIDAGLVLIVSSGNVRRDACDFSPQHPDLLLVGGSELFAGGERRRSLSNYGPCVDVHAAGAGVRAPSATSDTATGLWNGTSYAAPHVAGVAARILQDQPQLSPAQVKSIVVSNATVGELDPSSLPAGTPNLVLYLDPQD